MRSLLKTILLCIAAAACVYLGWAGLAGADDFAYITAATEGNPGTYHWGFRWPFIQLLRCCFSVFGRSEFVGTIPNLLSYALTAATLFWLSDGLFETKNKYSSTILFCTLPISALSASIPNATIFAANISLVGTLLFLRQGVHGIAGCLLLALSFAAHEMTFFYIAILCFSSLVVNPRLHWKNVLVTVSLSLLAVSVEALANDIYWGDPLIRWKVAASMDGDSTQHAYVDPRVDGGQLGFFLWPIRILLFEKNFCFMLLGLAFIAGITNWKHLNENMKIIFISGIATWFWLGYGTVVPWEYRPRSRAFHYYSSFAFHISLLIPFMTSKTTLARRSIALSSVVLLDAILIAASGSYHQRIETSRQILKVIKSESDTIFTVDQYTLRELEFLNQGNRLPNIRIPNTAFLSRPKYAVLHLDRKELKTPTQYVDWLNDNQHREAGVIEPRMRPLFKPIEPWLPKTKPFIYAEGAIIYELKDTAEPLPIFDSSVAR